MKKINVSSEIIQEAKNIVDGVYDPLRGFLRRNELTGVLEKMRLPGGEIWPMPVVLDINKDTAEIIRNETSVRLGGNKMEDIVLSNIEIFDFNKAYLAYKLFGTNDINHPGVANVMGLNDFFVGGRIVAALLDKPHKLYFTPDKTREIFRENKWDHVVAFQTRNPPHRSHEYLQSKALEGRRGLFINPVIGSKKKGDFKDHHILNAYQILIKKYHPEGKVHLGTLHTRMRYAGPKEALFHALVRKNFGCTHMIIGRDHAGVGDFYGPYEAQKIFDNFNKEELGIEILKFENAAYCHECGNMVIGSECGHDYDKKAHISGTQLRENLLKGLPISDKLMRREVVEYLLNNKDNLFV